MSMTLDDYAKSLAGLKQAYMSGTGNQDDIAKQGQQLRQQASASGIGLNELEDAANKLNGESYSTNDPYEQQFRSQKFDEVKNTPMYPNSTPTTQTQPNQGNVSQSYQAPSYGSSTNAQLEDARKMQVQLQQMMSQPFNFDPTQNATFQASQKLAKAAGDRAQVQTMEQMNDRGILNSSITQNQMQQIAQDAELEPLRLIPGLEQNAFNQRQADIGNHMGLYNAMNNSGMQKLQFDTQLPMQEAALTGKYMPAEARGIIDQILNLKQGAEHQFATTDQINQSRSEADILRNKLATLGFDPSLFGSDVSLEDAARNAGNAGSMTTQAQQGLFNAMMGANAQYGSMQPGTGQMVGNLPMFSGLKDFYTGLEGQPNLQQQQFDLSKEKFNFDASKEDNRNAIQWANNQLGYAKLEQQKDYQGYLQQKGMTEAQGKMATNGYLSQVLGLSTREDAMSYIVENAQDLINDGANVDSILKSIEAKWPKPKAESVNQEKDLFTINKTAMDMAQKDMRWLRARTQSEKDALIQEYKQQLTAK